MAESKAETAESEDDGMNIVTSVGIGSAGWQAKVYRPEMRAGNLEVQRRRVHLDRAEASPLASVEAQFPQTVVGLAE